jgi:Polysaccharide biosynthesis protein.
MAISKSKQRRIGGVISFIGLAISVAITIFYTPFMIKSVGTREYGIYSFVLSIVTYLDLFTTALAAGYIRFSLLEKKKSPENAERRVNSLFIAMYFVVSIAACLIGILLWILFRTETIPLDGYSESEKLLAYNVILISVVCLSARIPFIVFQSNIYYKEQYVVANAVALTGKLFTTCASLLYLLLSKEKSVLIIAIIQYSWTLIEVVFEVIFSKKHLKIGFLRVNEYLERKKELKSLLRSILVFSFFVLINSLVDILDNGVGKTVLGFLDPHLVTIFTLSIGFNVYLQSMASFVVALFQTEAADAALNEKDGVHMNSVFHKTSRIILLLMFFVVGGFVASGRPFCFAWLADNEEISSSEITSIYYYAAAVLACSIWPNSTYLSLTIRRAKNMHKVPAIFYILASCLNIGVSVLLVNVLPKEYAVLGCVMGHCLSTVLVKWVLLPVYDSRKVGLTMKPVFWYFIKDLLIASGCAAAGIGLGFLIGDHIQSKWLLFLICAFAYVVLFGGCAFLFEKEAIRSVLLIRRKADRPDKLQ